MGMTIANQKTLVLNSAELVYNSLEEHEKNYIYITDIVDRFNEFVAENSLREFKNLKFYELMRIVRDQY